MRQLRNRITVDALLLDGHVHFHDCFDLGSFLDAAVRNFRAGAIELGVSPRVPGCLLFAERWDDDFFRRLADGELDCEGSGWRIEGGDGISLTAVREDGARLILVAGRQIVTGEKIEVLALGCTVAFEDNRPLVLTLEEVSEAGAIPVLPWGFGKWRLDRGRRVEDLLRRSDPDAFFLGDNGGRPHATPDPGLFQVGAERGMRILPGSDPLPLPGQEGRVGRYGFALEGVRTEGVTGRRIREALRHTATQPRFFGRRESWRGFARSQIALRWGASLRNGR
jgi:hypothetical protein